MTPMTPSPHRFLAGQRRQASPTKSTRQPSALRKQLENDSESAAVARFAAAPRFSASRVGPQNPTRPPSPPRPRLIDALRPSTRLHEDVEDAPAPDSHHDEEMLDVEEASALPTTESDRLLFDHLTHDLPLSPKRRRTNIEQGMSVRPTAPPARPTFRPPETTALSLNATPAARFVAAQSPAPLTTLGDTQRPSFLRSSVAPREPSEPLPEAFSPHRRGQKFIPGGLAATVQQWVIETGQGAVQSRRGQAYSRGDDYVLRNKIMQTRGNGPFTLVADVSGTSHMNVFLAGAHCTKGVNTVRVGSTVGVRAPVWDIDIEGQTWKVGIDWKLLS
ncbi:hypothetical protein BAUCODRAFT_38539 [Baudoinia panamericana UAMH 10762]|uniref:Uncharacterized protein n=1 Tax=Baudoinia panamericana (strain UAMH 10762) TaxID=717646 RepID=M2M807_BAUPA|nr:uncharacterized protein BAUCODRAFT_38539 [Baudoinia panamericana UAMH 10762]EMC92471.1 hypothetical protein BAUCODRAFT_38539 [Baudoinia panamericana UAMH 10762]